MDIYFSIDYLITPNLEKRLNNCSDIKAFTKLLLQLINFSSCNAFTYDEQQEISALFKSKAMQDYEPIYLDSDTEQFVIEYAETIDSREAVKKLINGICSDERDSIITAAQQVIADIKANQEAEAKRKAAEEAEAKRKAEEQAEAKRKSEAAKESKFVFDMEFEHFDTLEDMIVAYQKKNAERETEPEQLKRLEAENTADKKIKATENTETNTGKATKSTENTEHKTLITLITGFIKKHLDKSKGA